MPILTFKTNAKRMNDLEVEIESNGHRVTIDKPKETGGRGLGMTPLEMALGSVGTCHMHTALALAPRHEIDIEDIQVEMKVILIHLHSKTLAQILKRVYRRLDLSLIL